MSQEPSTAATAGDVSGCDVSSSDGACDVPVVTCEVLVIGAGVSGLTAANEILKRDTHAHVCVVEAKDRVGGRTLTTAVRVRGGATEPFDLGGQWVGTTQTDIMDTLDELGLEVYPQHIQGTKVMQLGGDRIRRYSSTIPNLGSWWGLVQLQLFIWKVDRLARRCSPLSPCRDTTVADLDGLTVEAFARQHIGNTAALEAIVSACRVILGCDASRVGVVHFLAYVHAAGGLSALLEATPGTAQEFKVKGGTQQISERLADRVGRHRLYLSHPVTGVITRQDGSITVTTATGTEFRCQYVISAVPPNQLAGVRFEPALSPVRRELINNMPMGHLIKFVVTFEEAFWRTAGMSGEVVSNGGPTTTAGCTRGPVCITYDATSDRGSPALVGFIAGSASTEWQARTKEEREKAVISSLASFFGKKTENYIEYQEKVWAEEPYTGGCPVCFTTPGLMRTFHTLREPHGNVYFCGTELASRWCGFLSGAVQTGRLAALETLHALRPGCLSVPDRRQLETR